MFLNNQTTTSKIVSADKRTRIIGQAYVLADWVLKNYSKDKVIEVTYINNEDFVLADHYFIESVKAIVPSLANAEYMEVVNYINDVHGYTFRPIHVPHGLNAVERVSSDIVVVVGGDITTLTGIQKFAGVSNGVGIFAEIVDGVLVLRAPIGRFKTNLRVEPEVRTFELLHMPKIKFEAGKVYPAFGEEHLLVTALGAAYNTANFVNGGKVTVVGETDLSNEWVAFRKQHMSTFPQLKADLAINDIEVEFLTYEDFSGEEPVYLDGDVAFIDVTNTGLTLLVTEAVKAFVAKGGTVVTTSDLLIKAGNAQ